MEKSARAELIAALVTDKFSGFKDGDEAILEAASDVRLEEFRSASEGRKAELQARQRLETEHVQVAARLKVAEDRIKAGEQSLSEEEFLAKAPASIKSLVEAHKAEEAAYRASLISQLKDLGANTEDELKAKSTEDLKTLATYARVDVHVPDFSGRVMPRERNTGDKTNYAPPNPYEKDIKALQSRAKAH
jgi:hypothetical protein